MRQVQRHVAAAQSGDLGGDLVDHARHRDRVDGAEQAGGTRRKLLRGVADDDLAVGAQLRRGQRRGGRRERVSGRDGEDELDLAQSARAEAGAVLPRRPGRRGADR